MEVDFTHEKWHEEYSVDVRGFESGARQGSFAAEHGFPEKMERVEPMLRRDVGGTSAVFNRWAG